ncbi:hypothetical protein [Neotabrizicola shimadae]|uniref:DUF3108 domain-containing protein n=1 Tax=Neotabrizicola shimadae TaxID=2807096 RepID=A0A8G1EEP8_9RHOB|nr:hypothetical protein [Neotabrizicola shimadae]QYZ71578.1 hypothetical protein JO391_08820 [Neotabrizicola shimadae]
MLRLSLLLALLASTPVGAECLTEASLDSGVMFTRADGRTGSAVRGPRDVLRIDYALGDANRIDRVEAKYGIFTQKALDRLGPPGTPATETIFRRAGRQKAPQAGEAWKTRLSIVAETEAVPPARPVKSRADYQVTYSYQSEQTVTLSGCKYRMIPVEATFVGDTAHFTRRWDYFPELGLGLETRYTDHRTGIDTRLDLKALRAPQ